MLHITDAYIPFLYPSLCPSVLKTLILGPFLLSLLTFCPFFPSPFIFPFLVACTQLYTSLCRSVRQSVITSRFWAFRAERRAYFSYCPCPATILPLPTRTRLMLPCIRPCSFLLFSDTIYSPTPWTSRDVPDVPSGTLLSLSVIQSSFLSSDASLFERTCV